MSEWKKVRLGEIANYVNEKIDIKAFDTSLYISTDSMLKDKGGIGTPESIPESGKVTKYQHNDILVSNIRPYFKKIWFSNREGGCSNDVLVFRANDNIDSTFLYYVLSDDSFFDHMMSSANGTKMPRGNRKLIPSFEIPLPPLSTQHRIASILSRYDSLIENYQKQIKLLEEAAQRLYKEWFVDLRFPGHENTNIIDGVPEGWEKKKVNSIIELQSGFAFKSSTFDDNGAYKIVTIKNVKDGAFDGDNVSRIVAIPEKMPKHCVLADGDILLSLTGNVGRVCIVNGKNYLLNQRVAKLATDYKAFAYCLFRSRDMFIEVNNLANGAAQQNVSPIRIGGIKMLLPNMDMLQKFESTASKLITRIIYLQSQLRLLTEARDRLLPKLMSGEIEI